MAIYRVFKVTFFCLTLRLSSTFLLPVVVKDYQKPLSGDGAHL